MRGEQLRNTAFLLGVGIATIELSQYAFTSKSRWSIKDRAVERLGYLGSEISGRTDMPLQCAHINHKRGPYYNDPNNGVLVTADEHLIDHILRERENGLSLAANHEAIRLLTHQIRDVAGDDLIWAAYDFTKQPGVHDIWMGKIAEVLGVSA